jgi:hypothetical protein
MREEVRCLVQSLVYFSVRLKKEIKSLVAQEPCGVIDLLN